MDSELERQMKMLEGLGDIANSIPTVNTSVPVQPSVTQPPIGVETAETLLGEVPFVPAPAPIQPKTVAKATPSKDIMSDEPVFVNLAKTGFQTQTEFLKLKEGEKTKVTLVSPTQFIRGRVHYIEGLGSIKCISSYDPETGLMTEKKCCCTFPKADKTGEERAKQRLLVPVIEYPVSKADGKTIIQGLKPTLKMWNMNVLEERALKDILENYAESSDDYNTVDVRTFDLNLSKVKTNDFPTISLVPVASVRSRFPEIETIANGVTVDFFKTAYKEFARTVSEETIQNILINKQQNEEMANKIANQPVIDPNSLGI